jgi:hypothetical protein
VWVVRRRQQVSVVRVPSATTLATTRGPAPPPPTCASGPLDTRLSGALQAPAVAFVNPAPDRSAFLAASKSALAPAPPGAEPLRNMIRRYAPNMANLAQRGRSFHCRRATASTAKGAITTQPSGVTGPSPQPKRRGPNQALRPIMGVVRTVPIMPTAKAFGTGNPGRGCPRSSPGLRRYARPLL